MTFSCILLLLCMVPSVLLLLLLFTLVVAGERNSYSEHVLQNRQWQKYQGNVNYFRNPGEHPLFQKENSLYAHAESVGVA